MTEEMRQRIIAAIEKTWRAIAEDVADCEGRYDPEVIGEMVLDAYRIHTHGEDREAAEALYRLSKDEQRLILAEAHLS